MIKYRIKEVSEYGHIVYEVDKLQNFIFWEYWVNINSFLRESDAKNYIKDIQSGRKILSIKEY